MECKYAIYLEYSRKELEEPVCACGSVLSSETGIPSVPRLSAKWFRSASFPSCHNEISAVTLQP